MFRNECDNKGTQLEITLKVKKYKYMFILICAYPISIFAHTDNYQDFYQTSGCRLMLCLQNPNGPNSVQECQKDVNAFYAELASSAYHNVSIPICTPSLTNGSFFTIGKLQTFVAIQVGDSIQYVWKDTGKYTVSTYIGNKSWRDWAFSGSGNNVGVGLLSSITEKSGTQFLRVIPYSHKGVTTGGPYAQVLPKNYSLTKTYNNNTLINKYNQLVKKQNGWGNWGGQNSNYSTEEQALINYVNAWRNSVGQ